MNSLTSKEKRSLIKEFSPSPGFVLKLSRKQFEELVDDTINIDISNNGASNGNRFKGLLETCSDEQVAKLVAALRAV